MVKRFVLTLIHLYSKLSSPTKKYRRFSMFIEFLPTANEMILLASCCQSNYPCDLASLLSLRRALDQAIARLQTSLDLEVV